jgi:hypothetical protein
MYKSIRRGLPSWEVPTFARNQMVGSVSIFCEGAAPSVGGGKRSFCSVSTGPKEVQLLRIRMHVNSLRRGSSFHLQQER